MDLSPKPTGAARQTLVAGILTFTIFLSGCAYLRWPFSASTPPAPQPNVAASPTPAPQARVSHAKHRRHRRSRVAVRTAPSARPSTGESKPEAVETSPAANATGPAPEVTLAGKAPDPASSRVLLDEAGQRIRNIDRGKLSPSQAALYDQIN